MIPFFIIILRTTLASFELAPIVAPGSDNSDHGGVSSASDVLYEPSDTESVENSVNSLVGEYLLLPQEQFHELLFALTPQVSHLSLALSPRRGHH